MGRVLARDSSIAYWPEPRHVWTWGNSYRSDDELGPGEARPRVIKHIHEAFESFTSEQGKDRFCEKTPSNCLRVPFIHKVFPDARIILVMRDGRSVLRSTAEIQEKGVRRDKFMERALATPLWEWPAYMPRAASSIIRKVTGKPLNYFGPRPQGWKQWVQQDHQDVVRAKQWATTLSKAVHDVRALGEGAYVEYRYEEMMAAPRETMQRIVDYCELPDGPALVDHVAETVDPSRQGKWKDELDDATLERIRPHMEPTLNSLGYEW